MPRGNQRGLDAADVCRTVERIFREAGHEISSFLIEPKQIEIELKRAVACAPDVILIGGGDGTVSTAARMISGTGIALGILPMGTFNLAARDLGIPLEIEAAAGFLATAETSSIDVLDVSGHACLCITILSGDLTMRARGGELAAARAFVARLPRPCLVIPGNHDIPAINQPFDRFLHPFRRYQASFGPDLEPELIASGVHVVSMNSSRAFGFHADWSEGRLSTHQLSRMLEQFQNTPDEHLRILVLHHPLLELQIKGRAVVKPLEKLM
ncbi:MAG: diacylglycerol kinase family protein [Akkermansiaceae bacterium]